MHLEWWHMDTFAKTDSKPQINAGIFCIRGRMGFLEWLMGLRAGQQDGKSEICVLATEEIIPLHFQVSAENKASFF